MISDLSLTSENISPLGQQRFILIPLIPRVVMPRVARRNEIKILIFSADLSASLIHSLLISRQLETRWLDWDFSVLSPHLTLPHCLVKYWLRWDVNCVKWSTGLVPRVGRSTATSLVLLRPSFYLDFCLGLTQHSALTIKCRGKPNKPFIKTSIVYPSRTVWEFFLLGFPTLYDLYMPCHRYFWLLVVHEIFHDNYRRNLFSESLGATYKPKMLTRFQIQTGYRKLPTHFTSKTYYIYIYDDDDNKW